MDKIQKADYRFVPVNPDPNFSPEHNNYVIEKTIKEYDANRKKKHDQAVDTVRERAGALAVFLKSLEKGGKTSNLLRYFGKKEFTRLRGNDVRDQLDQLRILSPDGKVIRKVPR